MRATIAPIVFAVPLVLISVASAATFTKVALTGEEPPGIPGASFVDFFSPLHLNDNGQVTFVGDIAGDGITNDNDFTLFSGFPGSSQLLVRKSDPAPGYPAGVNFVAGAPQRSWFSGDGRLVFQFDVTGTGITDENNGATWIAAPGNVAPCCRSKAQRPACRV